MRKLLLAAFAVICAGSGALAATETWNQAGNWISYSTSGTDNNMNPGLGQTVQLDTFDEARIEATEGAVTLTRVVISVDGYYSGTSRVDNEDPTAGNFTVEMSGGSVVLSDSQGHSVSESYTYQHSFLNVGGDEAGDGSGDFLGTDAASEGVYAAGTGLASSQYTSGLSYFTRLQSGQSLNWLIDYAIGWTTYGGQAAWSNLGEGNANVSITYYYEPVPEPGTLALVGIGGLAAALRRRFGRSKKA